MRRVAAQMEAARTAKEVETVSALVVQKLEEVATAASIRQAESVWAVAVEA